MSLEKNKVYIFNKKIYTFLYIGITLILSEFT